MVSTLAGSGAPCNSTTGTSVPSSAHSAPSAPPLPVQVHGSRALYSALAGCYGVSLDSKSGHVLIADGACVHELSVEGGSTRVPPPHSMWPGV
jgi:hypothetical protein